MISATQLVDEILSVATSQTGKMAGKNFDDCNITACHRRISFDGAVIGIVFALKNRINIFLR